MHDRQLLLGAKRNSVLDLAEVERYGSDSFGDTGYVSIYGMRPDEWYSKGVRVLGRTAVECTPDELGQAIGRDVAALATASPVSGRPMVVDLFAGSGNTLYWLLWHLAEAEGVGFELDEGVFQLTRQNLAALALPIDVRNTDFTSGLVDLRVELEQLLIAFVAPPWGAALDPVAGLDLRRTIPPVVDIVDVLLRAFPRHALLAVIQIHETVEPGSLAEVRARFEWSELHVYGLNAPGQNHGVLLGTGNWHPDRSAA